MIAAGLLGTLALAGMPTAAARRPAPPALPRTCLPDATDKLERWLEQHGERGSYLPSSLQKQLEKLLKDTAMIAVGRGASAPAARLALLRAAGWGLLGDKPPKLATKIRARAQAALQARLSGSRGAAMIDWMLYEVLASGARYEATVRIVAVRALSKRADTRKDSAEKLLVGIMAAGRDRDALVRLSVSASLEGRPEAFVSDFFLSSLERGAISPEVFMSHIETLGEVAPKELSAWWASKRMRVFEYVTERLSSKDWRDASRGIALAPAFELKRVAPYLIEGLGVWSQREAAGSRRIVHEFATALTRLSGHDYGENVAVWARWWQAATEGGEQPEPVEGTTSAAFFGLRPVSDRVLFLIDRSGSMNTLYALNQTRFDESIDRLLYTLRDLGPNAEFGVVLFSNGGKRFSDQLETADDATLKRLEAWAKNLGPDGGTDLHSGIKAAFPGLETGQLWATSIPYDTVVVLCDGETEDAAWVAPWLAEYNQDARLLFHCVNIGGTPGGVLEALATGSGGAFIAIR